MANQVREAAKLMKLLHRLEQGFVYSDKYARLFDSHMKSVAIHEASHAVIATMLGVKVEMVEIGIERVESGRHQGMTSGKVMLDPSEIRRLNQRREGRVVHAAILLASRLTKDFKFEWQIDNYLVDAGFDGDDQMLKALEDENAVQQGGAFLSWAFMQPFVIDTIEAVAEVLNEKRLMFGEEVRNIVSQSESQLSRIFRRKELSAERFENEEATVLSTPEKTKINFLGIDLVVVSFVARVSNSGREFICYSVSQLSPVIPEQINGNCS